jgi:hypothetical protein
MRLMKAALVTLVLALSCAAQTSVSSPPFPSGAQGNAVILSGPGLGTAVSNTVHSSAFASGTSLATLLAACPASPTPCYVVLDPSTTAVPVSAATTIGSNTQQVIIEDQGVPLNCTGTTGADCIDLSSNGSLNCVKKGITSNSSGCQLTNSSTSNITSLITNTNHDGATGGTQFQLSGWQINPNNSSIITQAALWLVAVEGNGSYVRDTNISGMAGKIGSACTGQPTGIFCVVSIEDGPATGATADLLFDTVYLTCSAKTACVNLNITSGAGSGVGQNYVFNNLDVGDGSQATGCISGAGCMINIDGSVGGTNTSHYVTSVVFNGIEMESGSGESGNFIEERNCRVCIYNGVSFSGGPALSNGLVISQVGSGTTGVTMLTGRSLSSHVSNDLVDNTINGTVVTNAEPDVAYLYPGSESGGYYNDGVLNVTGNLALPNLTANSNPLCIPSGVVTNVGCSGSSSGANTALSNLAAVAINTALLPGTTNSIALGSASFIWSNLFANAVTDSGLTQDALAYAGSGGLLTGLNSPTANGNYQVGFNVTAGAAVPPTASLPGVPLNPQTGTTYTYLYSDRAGYVSFNNAGAIAVTLPQAGTPGFTQNWVNLSCDIGAGTATITPSTSTISYSTGTSYTSGATSLALATGQCAWIYSDNINYFAVVRSGGGGGGTTTNALTMNNSGSGASSGATFNGGTAVTLSYNTIGAADTTLNNLGTTAINAALLPATTNTIAVGSSADLWSNVFSSLLTTGTAPTVTTPGTGYYIFGTDGTEPASIGSGTSGFVMDSTSNCPVLWANATEIGCTLAAQESVISFSATPTFTATSSSNIITLTANVTSSTLAAGYGGQPMTITICQNGTGGFTFVWPSNVRGAMTIGSIASKCSSQSFTYSANQTAWMATGAGVINE